MSRQRSQPISALLALALLLAPSAASAYCIGGDTTRPNYDPHYYSVAHEFRRARYVAIVDPLRETWIGDDGRPKPLQPPFQFGGKRPWGFAPYMGAFYEVSVVQAFKGTPPKRLRLFSENSTARFSLDKGRRYLLFVFKDSFDPPIDSQLTIDTCGNSGPLARRLKALGVVRSLSHQGR